MIVALRRGAEQHKLHIGEFVGHVRPFALQRGPVNPAPSLTQAPDRNDLRGWVSRGASAPSGVRIHAHFPTQSQFFRRRDLEIKLFQGGRRCHALSDASDVDAPADKGVVGKVCGRGFSRNSVVGAVKSPGGESRDFGLIFPEVRNFARGVLPNEGPTRTRRRFEMLEEVAIVNDFMADEAAFARFRRPSKLDRSPPRRHDLRTSLRESKTTLQAATNQVNPSQMISSMESMN